MNNQNLNNATSTATTMSHQLIDELHYMGHEFITNAVGLSVPIINNLANTNLNIPKKVNTINFQRLNHNNTILLICELPGVPKSNCSLNYANNILRISGSTNNVDEWVNIENKKYYREINVGLIDKEKIVAKYENGTLKITLTKCNSDNITSNININ